MLAELVAVPIDVGKSSVMALVADFHRSAAGHAFTFALDRDGLIELVLTVESGLEGLPVKLIRVGVEAAGHYHRPLTHTGTLPSGWEVVELNPAHVSAQRGQRSAWDQDRPDRSDRDLRSDRRGPWLPHPPGRRFEVELAAWVAHRRRRVQVRTATKNQLLARSTAPSRARPGVCPRACWPPGSAGW